MIKNKSKSKSKSKSNITNNTSYNNILKTTQSSKNIPNIFYRSLNIKN